MARIAALVAAAFWGTFAVDAGAQDGTVSDRTALEALYDATGGEGWTDSRNWNTAAALDTWFGVTTDDAGRVTELELGENGLTGSLPPALGSLANLKRLSLWGNELTGPIPGELRNLVRLERLSLWGNELTGPVPAWLGNLTRLQRLDLCCNALAGRVPGSLGSLPELDRMDVSYNWGLSGPLPPELRRTSLDELDIFATPVCAPAAWEDWLETIVFYGRLCETATDATIDLAVVYTPAVRTVSGNIEAVIDLRVLEINQALRASGVPHRIALVGRSEVQYAESGDLRDDLNRLANPSDGYMDEAHALRDQVGADLVQLIVHELEPETCGLAMIQGPFSVAQRFCGNKIFAHELGHNLGLRHDRYQVLHHESGPYPHPAYGYVNPQGLAQDRSPARRWRTIMSYPAQCDYYFFSCTQLFRFSNPRQTWNDDPMGVAYGAGGSGLTGPADAAAVLVHTGPAVARWRERPSLDTNRPPALVGTLPDRSLPAPPAMLTLDVARAFADPDGDALAFSVSSSAPDVATVGLAGARLTLTSVGAGTATIRLTATDPHGLSATASFTATVGRPGTFTDDPIRPGSTPVRAIHFAELRMRIDALRRRASLTPFAWTDPVLTPGVTPVRLAHLLELREALAAAYVAAGRGAPTWTDVAPTAGTTLIRAAHLNELRAVVTALE
ncbi:MAG: M12 family metallo-peptidase [Gemmatimonadetes bacterium]|nr:M12 family metallo-peptidase [Gemmatimonadota bacterium]